MKIQYNKAELEAAAHFVMTFNGNPWPEAFIDTCDKILSDAHKYAADGETDYVQCGGLIIQFIRNDQPGHIYVEFHVDPTLIFNDEYDMITQELEYDF